MVNVYREITCIQGHAKRLPGYRKSITGHVNSLNKHSESLSRHDNKIHSLNWSASERNGN
jgi:hypothetical protein